MKSFLVIGLGEFGKSVAKTLYKNKSTVLAIDPMRSSSSKR